MRFLLRDLTILIKIKNTKYSLKDDKSALIKSVNKDATVIVWDRDDYLKESSKQLEDKKFYLQLLNNPNALVSTIFMSLERIRKRGDLLCNELNYFLVKDPKYARFYYLRSTNIYMIYLGDL